MRLPRSASAVSALAILAFAAPASARPFVQAAPATDSYPAAVLADQPALYLRLGERAGPFAFDSSGHGEDATYQAGVAYGASGGLLGSGDTAVTWSGGGNGPQTAVTQSGGTLPSGNAARTVEFWWRLHTDCNGQPAITYGGGAA